MGNCRSTTRFLPCELMDQLTQRHLLHQQFQPFWTCRSTSSQLAYKVHFQGKISFPSWMSGERTVLAIPLGNNPLWGHYSSWNAGAESLCCPISEEAFPNLQSIWQSNLNICHSAWDIHSLKLKKKQLKSYLIQLLTLQILNLVFQGWIFCSQYLIKGEHIVTKCWFKTG